MSVVKPKPKLSPQPITTNTNYPMNQSELEANTWKRRQEQENACERVANGWDLLVIGREGGAKLFNQSESAKSETILKHVELLPTLNRKPL